LLEIFTFVIVQFFMENRAVETASIQQYRAVETASIQEDRAVETASIQAKQAGRRLKTKAVNNRRPGG
jgi:hypothetical protein